MASDITIDAVRLALGGQQLRAEVAAANIAGASTPGFRANRVDLAGLQSHLQALADGGFAAGPAGMTLQTLAQVRPDESGAAVQLDAEVSEMVTASVEYQALAESLGRYFGLMRLALAGRAGA